VGAFSGGTAIGTLEYQRRPEAAGLPVRLTPRPAVLAGREELLAEIDARLAGGPGGADPGDRVTDGVGPVAVTGRDGPRVVVLCGLGGAGKTSVAVEYAHRHLAEVGVCWQFAAEDPTVLAAQFAVLAAQLGARDLADARDPVAAVHAVIARAAAGWLVVFDNVPDLAAVESFLPPAGPGRVLITSQSQHWPAGWAVQVPVLDPEVAARFLVNRTGNADEGAALELAKELGGLPLALEQAAAYMQATGTSLARYLPLFRERQADLLARGEVAGHREHTAATLGLALARLEREAPAAARLLRLLAFLAPEPVPLDLLLASDDATQGLGEEAAVVLGPLVGDPVAARDAVAALRRYSLATPAGDGLVQVHRLVQAVTRPPLTHSEAFQWERAAAALVDAAVPADAQRPGTWPACALLLPHARAILGLTSRGIWQIARYLGSSGSYPAALELCARIADARGDSGDYGPEHPYTLSARHELARWTGEAGDAAGARDQLIVLLPVLERVLGPDEPDLLAARGNLAFWAGEAGDAAGARDQLIALLPVLERVLGPEHPDTLAARSNLARSAGDVGDVAGALDQLAALLTVHEQVLGPEHLHTLTTRALLGYWAGEAGDAAGARDAFAVLLPVLERVLGPEHPYTLTTRNNLGYWAGRAGDAAGARDAFAALLPVSERVLGPDYPNTVNARLNLAYWTRQAKAAGPGPS
jgi:hypothetical protein